MRYLDEQSHGGHARDHTPTIYRDGSAWLTVSIPLEYTITPTTATRKLDRVGARHGTIPFNIYRFLTKSQATSRICTPVVCGLYLAARSSIKRLCRSTTTTLHSTTAAARSVSPC